MYLSVASPAIDKCLKLGLKPLKLKTLYSGSFHLQWWGKIQNPAPKSDQCFALLSWSASSAFRLYSFLVFSSSWSYLIMRENISIIACTRTCAPICWWALQCCDLSFGAARLFAQPISEIMSTRNWSGFSRNVWRFLLSTIHAIDLKLSGCSLFCMRFVAHMRRKIA